MFFRDNKKSFSIGKSLLFLSVFSSMYLLNSMQALANENLTNTDTTYLENKINTNISNETNVSFVPKVEKVTPIILSENREIAEDDVSEVDKQDATTYNTTRSVNSDNTKSSDNISGGIEDRSARRPSSQKRPSNQKRPASQKRPSSQKQPTIRGEKTKLNNEINLSSSIKQSVVYNNASNNLKIDYDKNLVDAKNILHNNRVAVNRVTNSYNKLKNSREQLNGKLKEKPELLMSDFNENADNKSVSVVLTLNDKDNAVKDTKFQVYKENELLREWSIINSKEPLEIGNLLYFTNYHIKTKLIYDLGEGNVEEIQKSSHAFNLNYKKLEIKDIKSAELFQKENGDFVKKLVIENKVNDLSDYYVKLQSENNKEMILPVSSIENSPDDSSYYNVRVSLPELVHQHGNNYQKDYVFRITKKVNNNYTSFNKLLDDIKANPRGTFVLGADLSANDQKTDNGRSSYLPGDFIGKLLGGSNGKNYAIYDLTKPLFETLRDATVENIDLKNVNINTKNAGVGSLAIRSIHSTIENVAVNGDIKADSNVGGIVYNADYYTRLSNVNYSGNIETTNNTTKENNVGGIAGTLTIRTNVNRAKADANIKVNAPDYRTKAGVLVGRIDNYSELTNSVAYGKLVNSVPQSNGGQVGGVVGSTWNDGKVDNVVSYVNVTNGNKVHGDTPYNSANVKNVFVQDGIIGTTDKWTNVVAPTVANRKASDFNVTATTKDSSLALESNILKVNYSQNNNYKKDYQNVYENVEKFIPFYNKELIIKYANQINNSSNIFKKQILDIIPMRNNDIVLDFTANNINKIMVHYKDGTIEYLDVNYVGKFAQGNIAEYKVKGYDLLYTPESFVNVNNSLINSLATKLRNVSLTSPSIKNVLNIASDNNKKVEYLYLEKKFNEVKNNIDIHLKKLLLSNNPINITNKYEDNIVYKKIEKEKEAFLLGLTYLQRWYDINYGVINIKDLVTYKTDFFGNSNINGVDFIINLGKSGYDSLVPKNNLTTYSKSIGISSAKNNLFDYLDYNRRLFLPNKTNNQWLKENSKAYIVEEKSELAEVRKLQENAKSDSKYSVGVYDKITNRSWEHKNMLLPLLTMSEESLYIISNMTTLSFGSYERYLGDNTGGKTFINYVRSKVDEASKSQRMHFDFWYKILGKDHIDKLFRTVGNYDGFYYRDKNGKATWRDLLDKSSSIQDFFGPINKWYSNNGSGAYANGSLTHFVYYRLLDSTGLSTFTHEMVHNMDGNVYFEGHGRREGLYAEAYALGLLQSPYGFNDNTMAINTIHKSDDPKVANSIDRMHILDPSTRIQNVNDLNDYVNKMFDLVYLFDYLEANSILKQSDEVKMKWYRKVENNYIKDKDGRDTHAQNNIRPLTAEEVRKLNTLDSLIDNDIINRRSYRNKELLASNGYYTVDLLSPIYSTGENKLGSPGDLTFRRMAFELLAAKGYHNGFLPYVSSQLNKEALAANSKIWSNWHGKYIGLINDDIVFKKVFGNEYQNWNEFKKDMYNKRIVKKDSIKPITIQYELNKPDSTQQININSFDQLQKLMDAAVLQDVKNIDRAVDHAPSSWVNKLKQRVYNTYLRKTKDFKENVFK